MVTALRPLGEKRAGDCARDRPSLQETLADAGQLRSRYEPSLRPLPVDKLLERYRRMFAVILRGCVVGEGR